LPSDVRNERRDEKRLFTAILSIRWLLFITKVAK